MSTWAAILISVFNPCTLLFVPLLFPQRWFSADDDDDRRVLASYGKYDTALHGKIEGTK